MSRSRIYRQAGRSLPYWVYVGIEVSWLLFAAYGLLRELWLEPAEPFYPTLGALAVLAILHATKMSFSEPWQFLKAAAVGIVAFFAAAGVSSMTGVRMDPLFPAALIGSAYYLWLGERWTRRLAEGKAASN